MKCALDVARRDAANGTDAISSAGAECGAISWVAMQVAIPSIISCKETVGFIACGMLRVRDLDDKRVKRRRHLTLVMTPRRGLVSEAGFYYACEVIHNEVFETAEILFLWPIYTPLKRYAHLHATEDIKAAKRFVRLIYTRSKFRNLNTTRTYRHMFEAKSLLTLIPTLTSFSIQRRSAAVPASGKILKTAAMGLFNIWVPVFLILIVPASLAYPSNTRSQSLTLNSDASTEINSQLNLTGLGQGYPVYPTTCFPPPSRRSPVQDYRAVLSDCSWIINEVLLQQQDLLFQDLLFSHNSFKDQSGNRYLSRWLRGRCVIDVACVEKNQQQILQLFNIVLAANKILKECIEDQKILRGGMTPIGSPEYSFYVGVIGLHDSNAANEFNISLLSNVDISGQGIQDRLLQTTSNTKSSIGDYNVDDSNVSLSPSVGMKKRASGPKHRSSLSTVTQNLVSRDALSTLNLDLPSTNLSGSFQAPPSYPVECFNPYSVKLKHAALENCQFIINQIILRYPNPMSPQTFGYRPSADIDLSLPQNEKWYFGHCVIFVRNSNKTRTDTFRMVDVAYTAHNIMTECVTGVKYPVGGFSDIGTVPDNFYVGVGGITVTGATNTTISQYLSGGDLVDHGIGTDGAL